MHAPGSWFVHSRLGGYYAWYYLQGRSQEGVQGVQLNPPSKLMIFMTIVMPWKIEGRNVRTVQYNFLCPINTYLELGSYSFVG